MKKLKRPKFKQIFDETYSKEKVFKFTWDYCGLCRAMFVRCPACGNNCCNAMFGFVTKDIKPARFNDKKAKTCPVCKLAYQYQDMSYLAKLVPMPTKKQIKDGEKGSL
jgi:hypothetical protein